jgi:hypothetical protein
LLLAGRQACWLQPKGKLKDLSEAEFRVFSQWGEDGILEWLAAHTDVPNTRFIEFGVETFREANCRFLMLNRNWRGLIMDGSEEAMLALRKQELYWRHDLTAVPAFITAENINELIATNGFGGPLGLLSVDIDGNDYWVWNAITACEPALVACEVNPLFGDTAAVTVPYDPKFTRFGGHHSGLYFGASLGALKHLAAQRGYEFLGTNSNGINAFFVKRELAGPLLSRLESVRAWPSCHRNSCDEQGQLTYARGLARFELIKHLPVVEVTTGRTLKLADIAEPFSAEWRAQL